MKQTIEITLENELKRIREERLYRSTNLFKIKENGWKEEIKPLKKEYVNIFDIELNLDMNDVFEIKHGRWAGREQREKFVEEYKEQFEKQLNIEEIKEGVELKKKQIKERNEKIQKLYDELYEVYSSLGYKADIKKLEELNELLYCEAEVFLSKMEDRIFDKKTAKAIMCYKKLMEIRGESKEIIECS